ncbi:MAG: hypothetical protein VXZ40_00455 [Nanoarchaeota archaeon]|nr:hypothetical protein [Nanoarchaeota archaeon]
MDEYFIEEKTSADRLLDFLVFVAVFVVTIFLILEILGLSGKAGVDLTSVNNIYFWVNIVVFVIFFADLVRLWKKSHGFKDFMSHNWLDVLATIPFELIALGLALLPSTVAAFGILKWFRFTKLARTAALARVSRVSKVSKEFKAASHLKKEGEEYQRKHRL